VPKIGLDLRIQVLPQSTNKKYLILQSEYWIVATFIWYNFKRHLSK